MSTSFGAASFNVNGIRARLSSLLSWLQEEEPELVCLQETKVQDGEFPREALEGYDPEGLKGSIGFHPEEHRALEEVRMWGFVDVFRLHVSNGCHYTFWDYRLRNALARGMGWRVDHIWATEPMAQRSKRAWIDQKPRRSDRPSDHTPILAEFEVD